MQVRLRRLKELFERHGLPWFEERDPALLRSDPFVLRHRAVTGTLASKEALALVIRHIVCHRGHHYGYYHDEGEFPWGDILEFKKVLSAIKDMTFTEHEISDLMEKVTTFGWNEVQIAEFRGTLLNRRATSEVIKNRLAAYSAIKKRHLRVSPKGLAFPRSLVWEHLEEIVQRHRHLLQDADSFLADLGVRPHEDKDRSIFFYHRKTPREMEEHSMKKTKKCRYARWLGLGDNIPCAERGDRVVAKFLALEFLATRRVELQDSARSRVYLPAALIEELLTWQEEFENRRVSESPLTWKSAKTKIDAVLWHEYGHKPLASTISDFNKDYFKSLQDLLCPDAGKRKSRASLSKEAAEELYRRATVNGYEPQNFRAAMLEYFQQRREAAYDPAGRYPQVEFLLGTVARHSRVPTVRHPNRKQAGEVATAGRLQRLFEELAPQLSGATTPDYCVIEVIGDPPRSERQKKEIAQEIEKRRAAAQARLADRGLTEKSGRTSRLRLKLFEQQQGRSPFTGNSLGENPFADNLQICHLYPDTRGGLFVEENLVLAPAEENALQRDRTPREAAQNFAQSWEAMEAHSRDMRWPETKRKIFAWNESSPPDFGNTTRMSQLARQLYVGVGQWMGIKDIPDPTLRENRRAERIGTPSGYLTSVARAAWQMPRKGRSDLVHHLIDAVTLSFIPPGEGMNSVQNGGIFFDQLLPESGKIRLSALPIGPDPAEIETLTAHDAPVCPVVNFRPASSKSSLHDQTILGLHKGVQLASHAGFDTDKSTLDCVGLRQALLNGGIPASLIPSTSELQRWLSSEDTSPLHLNNGQIVRRKITHASKEKEFFPGLGITARVNESGAWAQIKIFNAGKYEGLEIWQEMNARKNRMDYILQRVPDRRAMEALLRMGFQWLSRIVGNSSAEDPSLQQARVSVLALKPSTSMAWRKAATNPKARTLLKKLVEIGCPLRGSEAVAWSEVEKAIYGSEIPAGATRMVDPRSGRPVMVRKGDLFLVKVTEDGKLAKPGVSFQRHWFRVSAIQSDGRIKLKACRLQEWKEIMISKESIASVILDSTHDSPPDPAE